MSYERKLENILRTPWASDGKNFSQRIWKDRTQLVNNLQKNLSESVIRGDSDTDMIQALSKDEKRAEFNTRRLVETESAFFVQKVKDNVVRILALKNTGS